MSPKKMNQLVTAVKSNLSENTHLTRTEIEQVATAIVEENPKDNWFVILLKVLAYLIGLLLAGYGTASAATLMMPWMR